jgi:NAD(P)-dependent dehydrogenase (short-subunit alcohol dehydrogenase family)
MTSARDSRVWLITGCSLGLGRQIARAALERGDRVVATARRPESLDELIASAPERALAVGLDVTRADQIEPAVAAALDRFGRIDIVVNSAGYGSVGAVEEIEMDDLRAQMERLFFGAVGLTKAVLPHMREHGSGAIVQISSQAGQLAFPGYGGYCAAKHALEGMSEDVERLVAAGGSHLLDEAADWRASKTTFAADIDGMGWAPRIARGPKRVPGALVTSSVGSRPCPSR